jgi:glycosyltransferase involved in cell wall biosynthesis
MSIIYRGIETSRPRSVADPAEARRRLGLPNASPLLLSIGRLAPQKGHKYLIGALPQVLREFPETKLAIVGEGWLRDSLETQARALGVEEQVVFLGKRTDVPDLFAACDAFVFPSLFEGLGVSLLEACYAGCACISTTAGPIPEIIEDGSNGILVPPADSDALGRAVLRLARDPGLARQLGTKARARARLQFMLPDKVSELQSIYSRILPFGD